MEYADGFIYFLKNWMHPNWVDFHPTIEETMRDFVLRETNIYQVIECRTVLEDWIEKYQTNAEMESALESIRTGYWFSDQTMHGIEFMHRLRDSYDKTIIERRDVI